MASSVLLGTRLRRQIRSHVWPMLKEEGFVEFAPLRAYRIAVNRVELVEFVIMRPQWREPCWIGGEAYANGATFSLHVGTYFLEDSESTIRPYAHQCHYHAMLAHDIANYVGDGRTFWPGEKGEALEETVEMAVRALRTRGLDHLRHYAALRLEDMERSLYGRVMLRVPANRPKIVSVGDRVPQDSTFPVYSAVETPEGKRVEAILKFATFEKRVPPEGILNEWLATKRAEAVGPQVAPCLAGRYERPGCRLLGKAFWDERRIEGRLRDPDHAIRSHRLSRSVRRRSDERLGNALPLRYAVPQHGSDSRKPELRPNEGAALRLRLRLRHDSTATSSRRLSTSVLSATYVEARRWRVSSDTILFAD